MSYEITVTWMDGQYRTYASPELPQIDNEEIVIASGHDAAGVRVLMTRIPQVNVRTWTLELT